MNGVGKAVAEIIEPVLGQESVFPGVGEGLFPSLCHIDDELQRHVPQSAAEVPGREVQSLRAEAISLLECKECHECAAVLVLRR